MKSSGICPKCEGRKFWRIESMLERSEGNNYYALPAAVVKKWAGLNVKPMGGFETVICAACGYTEWYATKLDEMQADPEHGVYFVDNMPKAGLR